MEITAGAVKQAQQQLEALPKKVPRRTAARAVQELREELLEAIKKGYTLAELSDQLKAAGIKASASSLRRALRPAAPRAKARAARSQRAAATAAAAAAASS